MRVSGAERLAVAPQDAWDRLTDLERLGQALPGCQAVNLDGGDRFTAAFRPSTGLGVTPVRMDFEVVERSAPHRLRVKGAGGGPEYALRVDVELELADDGGGTAVRWSTDAHVAGVLGSLTQRVLPGLIADQVAEVLRVVR
jgi:carbon monoxide dehydrogenase subunit G